MNYYTKSYSKLFESLSLSHSKEDTMNLFVGGEFQKFGYLEDVKFSRMWSSTSMDGVKDRISQVLLELGTTLVGTG